MVHGVKAGRELRGAIAGSPWHHKAKRAVKKRGRDEARGRRSEGCGGDWGMGTETGGAVAFRGNYY